MSVLSHSRYVALKICCAGSPSGTKEIVMYEYLKKSRDHASDHSMVVRLLDHFTHEGPNGLHICLIFEAMGPSVSRMMQDLPRKLTRRSRQPAPPLWMAKRILVQLLRALNTLHACGIAHGDVQYGNLLFSLVPEVVSGTSASRMRKLKQKIGGKNSGEMAHVERRDGLTDLWAPKYLITSAPLAEFVDMSPGFTVKLSDFGSCKSSSCDDPKRLHSIYKTNVP